MGTRNPVLFTAIVLAAIFLNPAQAQYTQQGPKLVGINPIGNANQGYSVAISGDGNTAAVGGPLDTGSIGAVWVYTRSNGTWTQQGNKVLASVEAGSAYFGWSVALSGDGNTMLVGGPFDSNFQGAAWVFTRTNGVWTQQGNKLVGTGSVANTNPPEVLEGYSVALSNDGNTAIIGGPIDNGNIGAAWIFTRSNGTWTQKGSKLVGSGAVGSAVAQGISVAMSGDGNTALVGGTYDNGAVGAAWVFVNNNGNWTQQGSKLVGNLQVGTPAEGNSLALSSDGNTAVIGGSQDTGSLGAVWVFTRTNGVWTQQGNKLVGTGYSQGSAVAEGSCVGLSSDGNTLLIGGGSESFGVGATWIFSRANGTWSQQGSKLVGQGYVSPPIAQGGTSCGLSNDGLTALWGGYNDNGGAGAAWVFSKAPQAATHLSIIAPSSAAAGFGFTFTVAALDASNIVVSNYPGTVHFLTTDPAGSVPANAKLTNGTGTFQATLNTPGIQTISAVDTASCAITGSSNNVTVSPPNPPSPFVQQGNKLVGTGFTAGIGNNGRISQGTSVAISADGTTAVVGAPDDNGSAGAVWVFTRSNGTWSQQGTKLVGSNAIGNAAQGTSVAISSDGTTLIEGGPNDNNGIGAAWVFTRIAGVWNQQGAKLVGTGVSGSLSSQGRSIALSADGNTAAVGGPSDNTVGASQAGAGWVFTRSGGTWTQQGSKLTPSGATGSANLGLSAAISGDGNTIFLGGPSDNSGVGAVWPYARANGTWTQQGNKITGTGPSGAAALGTSVALSTDGNTGVVGGPTDASSAGAVWTFTRSNGSWSQQGNKLTGAGAVGPAQQGTAVALSGDGNTLIESGRADSSNAGALWIFGRSNGNWALQGSKLAANGEAGASLLGTSVAISQDANTAISGGPADNGNIGAAWTFIRSSQGTTHFTVTTPGTATLGTPFSFSVTAQDGSNNIATGYAGTVHFTSSDGRATLPVDSSLTFGTGSFQATFQTAGTQTITASDAATITINGISSGVAVSVPTRITINTPASTVVGSPLTFTVTVLDATNNVLTSYNGTVHFTSSDPLAALPANSKLTSGTGTFMATLNTVGTQTISGIDTVTTSITGSSAGVTVNPLPAGPLGQQGNKLVGTGAQGNAQQGSAVAISADGNTAVIGGPFDNISNGAIWVFNRSGGAWSQQGTKLTATGSSGLSAAFGNAIAISADGNTIIAGASKDTNASGGAFVFVRSNGVWGQQGAKLLGTGASDPASQGSSVALSADGNTAIIGAPGDNNFAGAAWIFTRTNGVWTQQGQKLIGSVAVNGASGSTQGHAVALSADGSTAAVSGTGDNNNTGAVWIYTRTGGVWTQQGSKLVGTGGSGAPLQGSSISLSSDGNTLAEGGVADSANVGATWVFTRTGTTWTQQGAKLVGTGYVNSAAQGDSVSLSGDGNTLLVGGFFDTPGAAWLFGRSGGTWSQLGGKLVGTGGAGNSFQGQAVALSADANTAIVGGPGDAAGTGAAWVYARAGSGTTHFSVTGPASAGVGNSFNITVTALDASGSTVTSYGGTVHFSSSDPNAVLPANATLSNGTGTFPVTFKTGGSQTVTATDTTVLTISGSTTPINVSAAAFAVPVSVSPNSGNTPSSSFTFTFSSAQGYQNLNVQNVLINNFLDGRHACYLAYSQPRNIMYLVDDLTGSLLGGLPMNATGSISNSQCTVSWTATAVNASGNNLALTVNIAFTAGFSGNKVIYMASADQAGNNSDWQALGTWFVPGTAPTTTTSVVGMTPTHGSGTTQTTFAFNFADTKGASDIGVIDVLVNRFLDGRQACYIAVSRSLNVLYLVNDAGTALLAGQSLGSAGSINNSQCTVSWNAGAVTTNGSGLTLNLNIAFSSTFLGNKTFYLATRDVNEANNTDWQAKGTWTVQ